MFGKKITNILLVLSVGIFLFGLGFKFGEHKNRFNLVNGIQDSSPNSSKVSAATDGKNLDFSLFWDAWDALDRKYVDKNKLNSQKKYYGAIKGMVSSVEDPYTFFLTPDENKDAKNDLGGIFQGIGAQLGLKDNRVIIVAPLKNSPAQKAGIKAGDYVNKVDDHTTKGWTLPQAVSKIRGPKGTKVKLTIERNSKEFTYEILRDEIKIESVELTYETKNNQKIAHLKVNQFGDSTEDEWNKAVEEIVSLWQKKDIKGIILDLRDNPGGYLESSVELASEFIPQGKVVVKQESTVTQSKTYDVLRPGRLLDIPVVILINKGSASASEILAGALRDHRRAKLVGEKSFGKGSVQEAIDLKDGAGIHITVAKWILPNGDWINGKGIQPDVVVENKIKEGNSLKRDDDAQLDKALELMVQ